jgi:host factor-I protein
MDGESRNLQNDFFNEARKSRSTVTVFLGNGKKLTGRIKSFDKFTLLLEGHQGELIIFKHAISTITTARWSSEGAGDGERRGPAPGPRPVARKES